MKTTFLSLSLLLLIHSCMNTPAPLGTVVGTDAGVISGVKDPDSGILSFKGIPFAAPPVGDLRWKAPQPVTPWTDTLVCEAFGPSPMQAPPAPFMFWSAEFLIPKEPIGEDCLSLNVWTGATTTQDRLPVLVYIYGGGFRSGGSGCAIYDGASMAGKGFVFVSINYRVGVFGFLAHPDLTAESELGTSGNYAILDMIAALEWVNRNIVQFGGDPSNVTIAGQSAGAFAVNYLTACPLAAGLFQRAIAESGADFVSSPLRPGLDLHGAEQMGIEFGKQLDAGSIAELRALPAEQIQAAQGGLSSPVIDGTVLPETVMESYRNGHQNNVPVLIGWNGDDRVMARALPAGPFREQIRERFGEMAGDFFSVYPADTEEEATQSQFDMGRDQTFGIQMVTWARVQGGIPGAPVYLYNFNRALPAHSPETAFGAFHSGEIVYAYDNLATLDRPWEPVDRQIAGTMSAYWANFVRTGDPNGPGLPAWEPYDEQGEPAMIIDTVIEQQTLPDVDKLNFWEHYYSSR